MTDIAFISNKPTVDLFLAKPQGIFSILDEESHFPKATDLTLARKLHQGPGKTSPGIYLPPRDGGPTFAVMHYAGKVQYDVCGILDKNRDSLPTSILFTMKTSDSLQIKEMFQGKVTRTGSLAPSTRQQKSRKISGTKSAFEFFQKRKSRKESKFGKARNKRERPVMGTERKGALTVAYHFKNSLADLMAKMNSASPHFIRCIKPNMDKTALVCVPEYVLAQLRYSGVMETVKLRQRGYAMRISCEDFLTRYDVLSLCCVPVETGHMTPLQKCKQALQNVKFQDYQVGHTKLFFRYWHVEQLDKVTETLQRKVLLAQKVVRGWLERRKYSRKLEVKRQQDRYVYQFLQGVYDTCVAVFSQLDSHRVQDIQRQEEEVEAENMRKTLEEIKRKEENRRSIEALDSILDQYDDEKTPDNVYYQPMDGSFDVAMETSTEQAHYMPMAGSDDEVFGSDHHVYGNIKRDGISQVSIRERVPPPSSEEAAYAISHLFPGEDRKMSFEHLPPAPPIPVGLTREEYLHFVQEAKTDPQGTKQPPPAVPVRSPDTRLSTGSMSEPQSNTDRKILGDYDLPADYDIACPVIQPPETEDQGDSCDLDPYSLPPPPLAWLNSIRRKGEKPISEVPPPDGSAGALPVDLEDYDQVEQVVAAYRKSQMPTGGVGAHQQRAAQQMSGSQQELPSRSTEQRWPPQEMNFPKGRKVAPPAVLPKPKKSSSSTPTTPSAPLNLGSPTPSQTDSTQSKIPMKPPVKNSENAQQVPRNKPVSDMRPVAPSADMRRASKPVQPGPPATYIAPPPPSFVPPPPPSVNQAQQRPPKPSGPSPGNVSQGQSGAVAAKVPKSPVKQLPASPGPQTEAGQRSNLRPGDRSPLTTSGARSSSGGVQDGPPSFVPPPPPGAPGGKRSSQGPPPSLAPQPKQTSGTGGPPSFTPPPPSPKHTVQGGQSRQPPGHHGPPPRPPSTASQPPPSPRHSSSPNRPKVSPPRPPSQGDKNVSGQPGPTALGQPSLPQSKEAVTQRGNGNGGQNNQKRMSGPSSAVAKPPPSPPALQNTTPAKVLKPKSPHTPMGAPPPPPPPPVSPATGKPAPTPSSAPPPPPPPPPGPPSNIPPPPPQVHPRPSCNIPPSSNVPPPNLPSAPPPPPPPPPPPSTSSAPPGGLLAGIANAKLKKVETGPGTDEERPMKSSKQTSAQSALIAQIQGGIKLKRSPGPKIKEIHRNDSVKVKNGPDSTGKVAGTGQSSIDPPGGTAKQEGPLSPGEGTEQINNTQQGASDFPRSPSGPNVTVVPVGNRPVSPQTPKNNAQTTVSSAIVTTDMPGPAGPATQKGAEEESVTWSISEKMNRLPLAGEAPVEGTPAWKRQLDEKKRREKEEEDRIEEERRRQEEIKWAGVPEWKKAIILKKENEKKAVEEQALAEERRKREEEAEYRRKYPWKFPNKDNSVSNGN
ncbi:unconventional myosin-XVI-like [Lingula anatina]|uniref:Unconventional myosin-XVI-like n=1 Tax=Lingula anatina TaxID=7574 RepID=A0A1S3JUH7_LINAN|nr:unconventional myosin-XVI-like [Lingula anatina]|eukprot:XP_013414025.1 unconventional myosin-XVI-like [Lingula anatina]